jgi:diguanylate cyclase (GGDEF)-like protein
MARERRNFVRTLSADAVNSAMSALLPVHGAMTQEWLVDAACTAAEQTLNASYTLVLFEDHEGHLEFRQPASDLRRRSLQRAIDAIGAHVVRRRFDPSTFPPVAEAMDSGASVMSTTEELLGAVLGGERAAEAAESLGTPVAMVTPLETAGERLGAIMVFLHEPADATQLRLLAQHVAVAAVNLRNASAAKETAPVDIVRSVFDARKLESELQRELVRAARYRRELSIVVIEATNLRLLRERFGRFLAERLVQRLGESLAQHAREIDVIGSYKESGYTMILAEAQAAGAAAAAERLLRAAADTRLEGEAVPGLELHLVSGHATCPADGTTSDALFAIAERRMYAAASQVA